MTQVNTNSSGLSRYRKDYPWHIYYLGKTFPKQYGYYVYYYMWNNHSNFVNGLVDTYTGRELDLTDIYKKLMPG